MPTLPTSANVPWKPEAVAEALRDVRNARPEVLQEYFRLLVLYLDRSYADIADTINRLNAEVQTLKTRYDVHNSHPPPA